MFASSAGADGAPMPSPSVLVTLGTLGEVGEGRRLAVGLADRLGFSEARRHDLGIVVTELATNAVRHGLGGQLLARPLLNGEGPGVEVMLVDKGPGMVSVTESLRDGHSTAGSMGAGLGAALRLADTLDVFSPPGHGTAIVARLWTAGKGGRSQAGGALATAASGTFASTAAVCVPAAGEQTCGDAWRVVTAGKRTVILLVDGLGHGPAAADAAETAAGLFERNVDRASIVDVMEMLHAGLRSTRGAAAVIAEIYADSREVRYVGVGNISATIVAPTGVRNLVSHNGTVGHQARRIQEFVYPWPTGAMLVLLSDGIATHWRLETYPGLRQHDPALVAGVLWRDFTRGRDDACVVVHADHQKVA